MPAPTLDGSVNGIGTSTTTVSAAALTTTGTNRIICMLVYIEHNTTRLWVTGVSGGGLTWNKRTQATTFPGSGAATSTYINQTLELWWAVAPSILSGVVVTATANTTFDGAAILVWGVAGCNTTNPWDANASLAAKQTNIGFTAPSLSNISTTQANDFLIFGWELPTIRRSARSRPASRRSAPGSMAAPQLCCCCRRIFWRNRYPNQPDIHMGSAFTTPSNAVIFDALTGDTGGSTAAPVPAWEVLTRKVVGNAATTVALDTAGISANDVLVALSYTENNSAAAAAITGISGGGLTWTRRIRSNSSASGSMEIWYAPVTGTLGVTTVTVTYASAVDNAAVLLMAITGCDASRWDASGTLAARVSNTGGLASWSASLSGVSTSQARDMVLAMIGTASNTATTRTVPTGFSLVDQVSANVGIRFGNLGVAIQTRSTTQTSATIACGRCDCG